MEDLNFSNSDDFLRLRDLFKAMQDAKRTKGSLKSSGEIIEYIYANRTIFNSAKYPNLPASKSEAYSYLAMSKPMMKEKDGKRILPKPEDVDFEKGKYDRKLRENLTNARDGVRNAANDFNIHNERMNQFKHSKRLGWFARIGLTALSIGLIAVGATLASSLLASVMAGASLTSGLFLGTVGIGIFAGKGVIKLMQNGFKVAKEKIDTANKNINDERTDYLKSQNNLQHANEGLNEAQRVHDLNALRTYNKISEASYNMGYYNAASYGVDDIYASEEDIPEEIHEREAKKENIIELSEIKDDKGAVLEGTELELAETEQLVKAYNDLITKEGVDAEEVLKTTLKLHSGKEYKVSDIFNNPSDEDSLANRILKANKELEEDKKFKKDSFERNEEVEKNLPDTVKTKNLWDAVKTTAYQDRNKNYREFLDRNDLLPGRVAYNKFLAEKRRALTINVDVSELKDLTGAELELAETKKLIEAYNNLITKEGVDAKQVLKTTLKLGDKEYKVSDIFNDFENENSLPARILKVNKEVADDKKIKKESIKRNEEIEKKLPGTVKAKNLWDAVEKLEVKEKDTPKERVINVDVSELKDLTGTDLELEETKKLVEAYNALIESSDISDKEKIKMTLKLNSGKEYSIYDIFYDCENEDSLPKRIFNINEKVADDKKIKKESIKRNEAFENNLTAGAEAKNLWEAVERVKEKADEEPVKKAEESTKKAEEPAKETEESAKRTEEPAKATEKAEGKEPAKETEKTEGKESAKEAEEPTAEEENPHSLFTIIKREEAKKKAEETEKAEGKESAKEAEEPTAKEENPHSLFTIIKREEAKKKAEATEKAEGKESAKEAKEPAEATEKAGHKEPAKKAEEPAKETEKAESKETAKKAEESTKKAEEPAKETENEARKNAVIAYTMENLTDADDKTKEKVAKIYDIVEQKTDAIIEANKAEYVDHCVEYNELICKESKLCWVANVPLYREMRERGDDEACKILALMGIALYDIEMKKRKKLSPEDLGKAYATLKRVKNELQGYKYDEAPIQDENAF